MIFDFWSSSIITRFSFENYLKKLDCRSTTEFFTTKIILQTRSSTDNRVFHHKNNVINSVGGRWPRFPFLTNVRNRGFRAFAGSHEWYILGTVIGNPKPRFSISDMCQKPRSSVDNRGFPNQIYVRILGRRPTTEDSPHKRFSFISIWSFVSFNNITEL